MVGRCSCGFRLAISDVAPTPDRRRFLEGVAFGLHVQTIRQVNDEVAVAAARVLRDALGTCEGRAYWIPGPERGAELIETFDQAVHEASAQ